MNTRLAFIVSLLFFLLTTSLLIWQYVEGSWWWVFLGASFSFSCVIAFTAFLRYRSAVQRKTKERPEELHNFTHKIIQLEEQNRDLAFDFSQVSKERDKLIKQLEDTEDRVLHYQHQLQVHEEEKERYKQEIQQLSSQLLLKERMLVEMEIKETLTQESRLEATPPEVKVKKKKTASQDQVPV